MNDRDTGDLEARLRRLEDQMEILQLIAAYGPVADSGSGEVAERMWLADGWYDSGMGRFESAAAVRDMLNTYDVHLELMAGGCAHVTTVPLIDLRGDVASAYCHGQLLRRKDDGFEVWKTSAVRWELVRTDAGWRIKSRENRLLDGSSGPHELFGAAVVAVAAEH